MNLTGWPPIPTDAAPATGGVEANNHSGKIRPTAVPRPFITPLKAGPHPEGHDLDDPAVRRYWTTLLAPDDGESYPRCHREVGEGLVPPGCGTNG